ncbi:MAG TPA: ATP-binding protein [Verrucomicrobiae bacterium]|jgi:signal transduction histidine kinase
MVALESCKLFSHLPAGELKQLQAVTREIGFSSGQEIFKEGDPGDGFYVVKAGQVQISALVATGERQVFSKIQPGDFFGEMAVLDDQPRSATTTAEGDTVVYFIPRSQLLNMLRHSPELSISLMRDISHRMREFNRQYIRNVLQAERMALVGRFASSIVHDLKNPLTIISMASEFAATDEATSEERRTANDRIGKQVERITTMVNDILEFTRGSASSTTLAPADYGAFVTVLVKEFQGEIESRAVKIELENPPPSVKVSINPQRLSRVFYNLIANACEAMPQGGRIKLRFKTTDGEVITEVEDTGKGIAPEVAEQLFEAFVTFGKPKGTGLGLSITQRIVEEHQGKISARNSPAGGAIFSFTLPWAKS